MQTLRTATAVFTLSPTRNVGELQAKLAKCNGKYKPTKIKADRRVYPAFRAGMSTAEYVANFEQLNAGALDRRSRTYIGAKTINDGFFAPLNTQPCTLYSGEDSFEIIGDVPEHIEAYELQGAALECAYAEFEALAA